MRRVNKIKNVSEYKCFVQVRVTGKIEKCVRLALYIFTPLRAEFKII